MTSSALVLKTNWQGDVRRLDSLLSTTSTLGDVKAAIVAAYFPDEGSASSTSVVLLKYHDKDHDLVTLANEPDWQAAKRFMAQAGLSVLKVDVVFSAQPATTTTTTTTTAAAAAAGDTFVFQRPTRINKAHFDESFSDADVVEVLRDLSFYIYARDKHPLLREWVSAEKTLLQPTNEQLKHLAAGSASSAGAGAGRIVQQQQQQQGGGVVIEAVRKWSVDDVVQFLTTSGFETYCQLFRDNDIAGDVLFDLSHHTLREIGMLSVGHRMRLLRLVSELALAPTEATKKTK